MLHLLALLAAFATIVLGENGLNAWLRFEASGNSAFVPPLTILTLNNSVDSPVHTAGLELKQGIEQLFGKPCQLGNHIGSPSQSKIIVGTQKSYNQIYNSTPENADLQPDGFWLDTSQNGTVIILGQNERGALYGAFEYLYLLVAGNSSAVAYASNPAAPVRWINQWDNLDGSIERGYAGNSIFFKDGDVVSNVTRAGQYARLASSIGLNAIVVNNVNANASILSPEGIQGLGRIADAFRPYGIQLAISLNFASPTAGVQGRGNLTTFDPFDTNVRAWWQNVTDDLYNRIPDMAGYLVKADSEGQPGPLTYNRTLADGANLFANVVSAYGGLVLFRSFVYTAVNNSDWKADRAKQAVQYFAPLDGQFEDNVVVQIKYGPIDFQVREPASPLFSQLQKTNTALEVEISQEYLGQQSHWVYLPPLWKTITDFDFRVNGQPSLTRDIVSGQRFSRPMGGYAGVVNVGTNLTWLGNHLAMSNLYAFGRIAWDPTRDSEAILEEWTTLTYGSVGTVLRTVKDISMPSWSAFENYTGNLGMQSLTEPATHYGADILSRENDTVRADRTTVGFDRTVSNGTGYSGQYPPEVAAVFEDLASTPDNLLLWFHHVSYTHVLHNGQTVIQYIYDAHYNGAQTAAANVNLWKSLQGMIDDERYEDTLFKLSYQAGHAIVWRDAITGFFFNSSTIPDDSKRVGFANPYRIEAESMTLDSYIPYTVHPFATASNNTAIVTSTNATTGTASTVLNTTTSGTYDIGIVYFDLFSGSSHFELFLDNDLIGAWDADFRPWIDGRPGPSVFGRVPTQYLSGSSATRTMFHDVFIEQGATLKLVGYPQGVEPAPLDYVTIVPSGVVD